MLETASQIGLCLLVAGLLSIYIGYLLGKESCNSTEEFLQDHH